jgi:hypothetical protein
MAVGHEGVKYAEDDPQLGKTTLGARKTRNTSNGNGLY